MSIYRGASMDESLVVSFDLHGVIDHDIEFFREMANDILAIGGKVIVISGSAMKEIREQIELLRFPHTDLFSVTDFLIHKRGEKYVLDKHGRPSFEIGVWNSGKAEIIKDLGWYRDIYVTCHYDDTLAYRKYFPDSVQFYWYKRGKVVLA